MRQALQKRCARCNNSNVTFSINKKTGKEKKTCDRCIKQTTEYHKKNMDRTIVWNKKSRKKLGHLWAKKPEQVAHRKDYNQKYWEENKERLLPINRKRNWGWYYMIQKPRLQKPEQKYKTYQLSSKRGGKEFDISFEQFMTFWNKPCYYCGVPVATIGLDRINNDVGYVMDNIVSCCTMCNWMKRSFPEEIFVEQCIRIANNKKLCEQN